MEKNMPKYFTYRYAMDQIKKAIESGFYLEAITIEESILVDRLYRFCKDKGIKEPASKATLGSIINCMNKLPGEVKQSEDIDFLEVLDRFRDNRNTCLHQIAKSEPGEPTMPFEEFVNLASETALNGKLLIKKVGNWSKRYKRKVIRDRDEPSSR